MPSRRRAGLRRSRRGLRCSRRSRAKWCRRLRLAQRRRRSAGRLRRCPRWADSRSPSARVHGRRPMRSLARVRRRRPAPRRRRAHKPTHRPAPKHRRAHRHKRKHRHKHRHERRHKHKHRHRHEHKSRRSVRPPSLPHCSARSVGRTPRNAMRSTAASGCSSPSIGCARPSARSPMRFRGMIRPTDSITRPTACRPPRRHRWQVDFVPCSATGIASARRSSSPRSSGALGPKLGRAASHSGFAKAPAGAFAAPRHSLGRGNDDLIRKASIAGRSGFDQP